MTRAKKKKFKFKSIIYTHSTPIAPWPLQSACRQLEIVYFKVVQTSDIEHKFIVFRAVDDAYVRYIIETLTLENKREKTIFVGNYQYSNKVSVRFFVLLRFLRTPLPCPRPPQKKQNQCSLYHKTMSLDRVLLIRPGRVRIRRCTGTD